MHISLRAASNRAKVASQKQRNEKTEVKQGKKPQESPHGQIRIVLHLWKDAHDADEVLERDEACKRSNKRTSTADIHPQQQSLPIAGEM